MAEKNTKLKEDVAGTVSFKLNTGVCPLIDANQYYTAIEFPEQAEYDDNSRKIWDDYVISIAKKYIEERVAKTDSAIRVTDYSYFHPRQYNYQGDEINFTVILGKTLLNRLIARHKDNQQFINFLSNYKPTDGFISNLAEDQREFIEQSKSDPSKSLVQILVYNALDSKEQAQREFEEDVMDRADELDLNWNYDDAFNDDVEENYRVIGYTLDEEFNLNQIRPRSFADLTKAQEYGSKLAEGIKGRAKITYVECYDLNNNDKVVWQSDVAELNEWANQIDEFKISDKEVLTMGAERGSNDSTVYYVEKANKPSDSSDIWNTDFHKTFADEQSARKTFNRYKAQYSKKTNPVEESRGGFVRKYKGYSLHDTGDTFTITDEHGKTVETIRYENAFEDVVDELISKKGVKESAEQTIKTPRGEFRISKTFKSKEEANADGFGYYFTHKGVDIYTKPLDDKGYSNAVAIVGELTEDVDDGRYPFTVYMAEVDGEIVGEDLTRTEARQLAIEYKNKAQDYIYITGKTFYERHGHRQESYEDVVDVNKVDGKWKVVKDTFKVFTQTESAEGDQIAKDYIASKDANYEKDKEAERQAKVELAKNGIDKDLGESFEDEHGVGGGHKKKCGKGCKKSVKESADWKAPYQFERDGNTFTLVKDSQTKDGADYRGNGGMITVSKDDLKKVKVVKESADDFKVECDWCDQYYNPEDLEDTPWGKMCYRCKADIENAEKPRVCSECGKKMSSGYVVNGGLEYYCSDECLHKHYTEQEWEELYDDGNSDSYWTEWDVNENLKESTGVFGKGITIKINDNDITTETDAETEGDTQTSVSAKVEGLTDEDIARIKEIGYSTTFKNSKGNDIADNDIGDNIEVYISYNDQQGFTLYSLDINKNLDLIYFAKEQGNFFTEHGADHVEQLLRDWLDNGGKKPMRESKVLNEGPGAGYSISATTTANKINSFEIKSIEYDESYFNWDGTFTIEADCDIDATVSDLYAESYYYDGVVDDDVPAKITKLRAEICFRDLRDFGDGLEAYIDDNGEDEYPTITKENILAYLNEHQGDLQDIILGTVCDNMKSKISYGGGWVGVAWDGTITRMSDEYPFDSKSYSWSEAITADITVVDEDVMSYISKAVYGDNITTSYTVYDEDNDIIDDFADKDEAISCSKKHPYSTVEEITWRELSNGDTDSIDSETIFTNGSHPYEDDDDDDIDEGFKYVDRNSNVLKEDSRYQSIIDNNYDGINDKIKALQKGQELAVKITHPFGYNTRHIKRNADNDYFTLWDTNDKGETADTNDYSSLDNAMYWANTDYISTVESQESAPGQSYAVSKVDKQELVQGMIDEIAMSCQCDTAEVYTDNGCTMLKMPVDDSDCEYYWDEYGIEQQEIDGRVYNVVNVDNCVKKLRKFKDTNESKEIAESGRGETEDHNGESLYKVGFNTGTYELHTEYVYAFNEQEAADRAADKIVEKELTGLYHDLYELNDLADDGNGEEFAELNHLIPLGNNGYYFELIGIEKVEDESFIPSGAVSLKESQKQALNVAYAQEGKFGFLQAVKNLNESLKDRFLTETLKTTEGLDEDAYEESLQEQVNKVSKYLGLKR